jgi:TetR/AcrR family transcriptional repressor of bet genes
MISATDEVTTALLVDADVDGRRSQIVRAAAAVLGRQGYAETSLKDVAREAGVAPGLLHYYFESKEELLLEVVTVTERQMVANWKSVVEAVDDPLERIVTGLDHAEARCAEQPEFFRLLLDLYTVSLSSPALRTRCATLRAHLIDEIEIELRQVLGRLPAYSLVTPRELAGAVLSAIDGIALSSLVVEQATAAPFRALKVLLLSLVVTAYVTAGQDPPIARLGEMLSRHP